MFLKFLLFMRLSCHFADSVCSILSSKSTCFRRRSDSHWTILSEKLFLCNQIYRLFHAFSFLIIPSDDLLCDMKHIIVSFSDKKISPLLTPFINNAVDLSVNFILLLFCSFVAYLYDLCRIRFIVRFISLDLQFYQQLHTLLLFLVMQGKSLP